MTENNGGPAVDSAGIILQLEALKVLGLLLGGGRQAVRRFTDEGTCDPLERDLGGAPDPWLEAQGSRGGVPAHARPPSEVIRLSGRKTEGKRISTFWRLRENRPPPLCPVLPSRWSGRTNPPRLSLIFNETSGAEVVRGWA